MPKLPVVVFTLVALFATSSRADERQLVSVRYYHLASADKAAQFDNMMRDGAMSVFKRQGIGPVGVFQPADAASDEPHLRVVITPFDSFQGMLGLQAAFQQDPDFWPNAQEYLVQDKNDPAFARIESMLLMAFTGMPKLAVPGTGESKKRLFELRTYESHSEIKGLLKVQMFNDGEIELFEKVGLPAVFYGEAIVAGNLPQLTYMLVHDDEEAQKAGWARFLSAPEWEALKVQEQYQDTVSKIVKHMLVATDYSAIK